MPTVALGPATVDLTGIRAGDVNIIAMTLTAGGLPFNLTGKVVSAQARLKPEDTVVAIEAVIEVTDAAAGSFTLRWPGSVIAELMVGKAVWAGVWDLQVGVDGEDAQTLLAGRFNAVMDVTR